MGPLVMAWLLGEGIVTWRWAKGGAPPTPGALAISSGFFALCALLAEYPPARTTATLLAFGIDLAALLQILPGSKIPAEPGWPPPLIDDPTQILPGSAPNAGGGSLAQPPGKPANPLKPFPHKGLT